MIVRLLTGMAVLRPLLFLSVHNPATPSARDSEYAKHFAALSKLSIAVAQSMPADQYGFKPHPESMNFGELMSHIATTNYQFCAGLKDAETPTLPSPRDKNRSNSWEIPLNTALASSRP